MADKRIDQLPAAPAAHDDDLLVADQDKGGGVLETRKLTVAQVQAHMQQALDSRYSRLAGGDDADFVAMPKVDGSPIVESGSNANGSWTKWADGTMICSRTQGHTGTSPYTYVDWTFPQEFSSAPAFVGGSVQTAEAFAQKPDVIPLPVSGTLLTDSVRISTSYSGSLSFVLFAKGRWK